MHFSSYKYEMYVYVIFKIVFYYFFFSPSPCIKLNWKYVSGTKVAAIVGWSYNRVLIDYSSHWISHIHLGTVKYLTVCVVCII